jgi:hypothetical protein
MKILLFDGGVQLSILHGDVNLDYGRAHGVETRV